MKKSVFAIVAMIVLGSGMSFGKTTVKVNVKPAPKPAVVVVNNAHKHRIEPMNGCNCHTCYNLRLAEMKKHEKHMRHHKMDKHCRICNHMVATHNHGAMAKPHVVMPAPGVAHHR